MKITKIELNDFRAFAHPESFDLADGNNVLLFGANGAGKSSLFSALKEVFNHASPASFLVHKNIFTDPLRTDGYVRLHFSLPAPGATTNTHTDWPFAGPRPNSDQRIVQGALRLGVLDYRSLLDTNYVFRNGDINLFEVLANGVLRPWMVNVPGRGLVRLGTLWDEALASRVPTRSEQIAANIAAGRPVYSRIRNQTHSLIQTADAKAQVFGNALQKHLRRLVFRGNRLLRRLGYQTLAFVLKPQMVRYNGATRTFDPQNIEIRVSLNGKEIKRPQRFLNEARLSALALALYLAALLEVVPDDPTWPRVLVLDDVLIGLDMDNRLPVLDIVRKEFRDWQVFLLTHDRTWFEVALIATAADGNWTSFEMHPRPRQESQTVYDAPWVHRPAPRIKDVKNVADEHLAKAQTFLTQNDDRTAAFHVRVAFEAKLKAHCHDRELPVRYMLDGRRLDTDDFLEAIGAELSRDGKHALVRFQVERVKLFRRGVLNPYAHYHPVTISAGEVREAIRAVQDLSFHNTQTDFPRKASDLLAIASPTPDQILDAACWLRTAFEVDLRAMLARLSGKLSFRHDWNMLPLSDLWDSAIAAMTATNATLATGLISDVQSHHPVFLRDWSFAAVSAFTQPQLVAAWGALKDSVATNPRTRLATFA